MQSRFTIAALALALLVGAGIFFLYQSSHRAPLSDAGHILPDLTFQDYSGNTVSLSDFAGKPVVLQIWASWCPLCSAALKDLATLHKEVGNSVTMIAVNRKESLDTAKQYSDAAGLTNSFILLLDPHDNLYSALEGFSMPETIFIDKNGLVHSRTHGIMQLEELRRHIQDIL